MHLVLADNLVNEDVLELFGDVGVVLFASGFGLNCDGLVLGCELFIEDVVCDALAWLEVSATNDSTVICV